MWIVCITSVRHVLTVNGYGGRQTKENEKSWCFKGWETLVTKMFRFIQLKNVCSSTAKAHPHLLNGLSECIPSTDIPYVSAIKRRSAQMDTLRTKHFRAESICLVFQNIQHRTEYSHLCLPPGLQSLDSAQMSN